MSQCTCTYINCVNCVHWVSVLLQTSSQRDAFKQRYEEALSVQYVLRMYWCIEHSTTLFLHYIYVHTTYMYIYMYNVHVHVYTCIYLLLYACVYCKYMYVHCVSILLPCVHVIQRTATCIGSYCISGPMCTYTMANKLIPYFL